MTEKRSWRSIGGVLAGIGWVLIKFARCDCKNSSRNRIGIVGGHVGVG